MVSFFYIFLSYPET